MVVGDPVELADAVDAVDERTPVGVDEEDVAHRTTVGDLHLPGEMVRSRHTACETGAIDDEPWRGGFEPGLGKTVLLGCEGAGRRRGLGGSDDRCGVEGEVRNKGAVDRYQLTVAVEVSPKHAGKDRNALIDLAKADVGPAQAVLVAVDLLELTHRILDAEYLAVTVEEVDRPRLEGLAFEGRARDRKQ